MDRYTVPNCGCDEAETQCEMLVGAKLLSGRYIKYVLFPTTWDYARELKFDCTIINSLIARKSLPHDSAKSIVGAIVGFRLDYVNAVLVGVSASNIKKLQRVQNTLACIFTRQYSYASTLQSLAALHSQLNCESTSRSPPSLTNFFRPDNCPTWPVQSLYMPPIAHSGQATSAHSTFPASSL